MLRISRLGRRLLAVSLIILGAILLFLVTDSWLGLWLVLLGIAIEGIGVALKHQ